MKKSLEQQEKELEEKRAAFEKEKQVWEEQQKQLEETRRSLDAKEWVLHAFDLPRTLHGFGFIGLYFGALKQTSVVCYVVWFLLWCCWVG